MMWFFAMLIVVALGVVAAVASGRGEPMSKAYDDRPDAVVPATGPLSATDLRQVRFSLAFRGYRMSEVDALLDRLATERETSVDREPDREPDAEWGRESAREPAAEPDREEG